MFIITKKTREYEIKVLKSLPDVNIVEQKAGHLILEIKTDRGLTIVDFYTDNLTWFRRNSYAKGESVRSLKAYFKLDRKASK